MSLPMDSNSQACRVLALVAEGPATTADVVAEFGWTPKLACAVLLNLRAAGKVERKPFRAPGLMSRFLYSITPRGQASLRSSRPGVWRAVKSARAPTS